MKRLERYNRTPTSILEDNIHIDLNEEEEAKSTDDSQARVFQVNLVTFELKELGMTEIRGHREETSADNQPSMLVFREVSLESIGQLRRAFLLHPVIELECKSSLYNIKDSVLSFERFCLINFAEMSDEEDLESTCGLKLIIFPNKILCIATEASFTLNHIGKDLGIPQLCSSSSVPSFTRKTSIHQGSDTEMYEGLTPVEALLFRIFHVNISRLEGYVLKLLSEAMFTSVYASEISYHERVDFIWRLSIANKSLIHLSDLIKPKTKLFEILKRSELMTIEFSYYLECLISRCNSLEQRINTAKDLLRNSEQIYSASADDYLTTLSYRTNEVMRIFSAVATIFLPLNLIAALWGMNVQVPLNGTDYPTLWPFFMIVGGCAFIAVAILFIFYRKKLL